MLNGFWRKIIKEDEKRQAEVERAIERIEKAHDKRDRKKEQKELRRFEKIADREMFGFNRETKRDYW